MKLLRENRLLAFLIIIWYGVGVIGYLIPVLKPLFQLLTPLGLMVAAILLMVYHHPRNTKSWIAFGLIVVISFLAEVIGVNTHRLFGDYEYGPALGPKLWNTPLVIGLNWLILIYCISTLTKQIRDRWYFPLVGASIMVAFDWVMEPVAVKTGMWSWHEGTIPVKNYMDWFLISGLLFLMIRILKVEFNNRVALVLFIMQGVFFLALNILTRIR